MPCTAPIDAWQSKTRLTIGHHLRNEDSRYRALPCGGCFACIQDRRRSWALRAQHEASLYDHNQFLTLTYDDEHLPPHGSLDKRAFQLFMKRLRKHHEPRKIRFLACGEYGTTTHRAHYHALLFNSELPDKTRYGKDTWTSETVSTLWPLGTHLLGTVTPQSVAYVAGYVNKKISAELEQQLYREHLEVDTGELYTIEKPFRLSSTQPGLGHAWLQKYRGDLQHGYLNLHGVPTPIPRYYETKYKEALTKEQIEEREWKHEQHQQQEPLDHRLEKHSEQARHAKNTTQKKRYALLKKNHSQGD